MQSSEIAQNLSSTTEKLLSPFRAIVPNFSEFSATKKNCFTGNIFKITIFNGTAAVEYVVSLAINLIQSTSNMYYFLQATRSFGHDWFLQNSQDTQQLFLEDENIAAQHLTHHLISRTKQFELLPCNKAIWCFPRSYY